MLRYRPSARGVQHVQQPLQNLEQWDDFVAGRYDPDKKTEDVSRLLQGHAGCTEVLPAESRLSDPRVRAPKEASVHRSDEVQDVASGKRWDYLNTLVDDSDPRYPISARSTTTCKPPKRSVATDIPTGSS